MTARTMSTDGRGIRRGGVAHGTVWYRTVWRRALAVAAVLAMTFALAPHQPGRAQQDQVDEAQDQAEQATGEDLPALWSPRKVSITENYTHHKAPPDQRDQDARLWGLDFPTEDVGYAVGAYGGGSSPIRLLLKTTDGGTSWSSVPASLEANRPDSGISFPTEDIGYVTLGSGGLQRVFGGGTSADLTLNDHYLATGGVAFVTPELGWATGKWNCPGDCGVPFDDDTYQVLMTTDGGATWEARSSTHESGAHMISTDRGLHDTWEAKSGNPDGNGELPDLTVNEQLQAIGGRTVEDTVLYLTATKEGEIYRSDDAGASWTPLGLQDKRDDIEGDEEIDIDELRTIHAVDEEVIFVIGEVVHANLPLVTVASPSVARTTDGGETWQDITPDLAQTVPDGAEAPDAPPPVVELRDIAVARDADGGLTGHVVGAVGRDVIDAQGHIIANVHPVVFTTTNAGEEDADAVKWEPEPVDLSAFPDWRVSTEKINLLGAAAVSQTDPETGEVVGLRSLAVGDNWAIVERTTNPLDWPPTAQDACLPPGLVQQADGGEEGGQVAGQVEDVEGTAGVPVVCEPLADPADRLPAAEPAFTPVPAGTCDVDHPEAGNTPDDPDATFPCLGDVDIYNERGTADSTLELVGYDEALGRVVFAGSSKTGDARVVMFDPVEMVQRGVDGFGDGFAGDSAWGHHTGAVNLADADGLPQIIRNDRTSALMPIAPEERRHSLALLGCGSETPAATSNCVPASVVTVSLTGEFTARVAHTFDPVDVGAEPHVAVNVVHLAYDESNDVLYALTEYNSSSSVIPAFGYAPASMTEPQTVLHALDADSDGGETPGDLRPMWSMEIDRTCKRAAAGGFRNMGVSPDGRALVFGCQGADVPHWGFVNFTPHGFMRVGLPPQVDPGEMTQIETALISQSYYSMPAAMGTGRQDTMFAEADSDSGLFFWNAPRHVTRVFDFVKDRWIGSFQTRDSDGSVVTESVAVHPDTGRLYIVTDETQEDPLVMRMAETVNLPVSSRRPVELATGRYRAVKDLWRGQVLVPHMDRLITIAQSNQSRIPYVRAFEDRIPPAQHLGVEDPDADTNDIDEGEAATVRRDGAAHGYGSRVWWSGLRTTSPGFRRCFTDPCTAPREVTWSWLFDPATDHGHYTSGIPGMVSSTQREAMFGRVSTAELTASSDEKESEAVAASQGVDDDTQGDVRRRRLLSEWRRYVDDTVLGGWHDDFDEGRDQMFGNEGWREFERCMDEGADRLWRELDGERRVSPPVDEDGNQPDDCFAQFDEDDPRGADRSSLMEDTGAVAASRCHDENTGNPRARTARGAEVDCDAAGERTEASAELGAFELRTPEGQEPAGWLSVGSSTSDATVVRDADRGIVVESTASASDIEMGMAGQGTLRIGEVRSKAKSWAKGRPGTADSWLDVAFEDVRITDADGQTTRYSCGRAEKNDPVTPDEGLHRDDDEVDGQHGACDPQAVVDAINAGFGNRVQATTPDRDTADKVAGSPRGARAIVRRDPGAYWSDRVINNFSSWEIPALQLTFLNDSAAGPNRMMVDLAGVFTEANYVIGDPLGSYDSGGGTDGGDGNDFDPGPATVTVELTDTDGTPLADGQFGLTDQDGAPTGTCTTDTSGTCDITGLPAGDYQVSQVSAPAGYLPADDTVPLSLAAGGHATVTFANVWAAGGVTILLTDPAEEPLADGAFELLVGDGDGNATVFDTCTTAGDGTCAFPDVPLGDVAVRQTATPDGYQPAEPVAFALTSPGQVARLHVINGPAGAGTSGTRGQVVDDPMPQTERISLASSQPEFTGGTQPQVAEPDGLLGRALVLPGQVARFALRNPGQALLFTLVWLLVGAPLYLAVRRRELNHIKQWS